MLTSPIDFRPLSMAAHMGTLYFRTLYVLRSLTCPLPPPPPPNHPSHHPFHSHGKYSPSQHQFFPGLGALLEKGAILTYDGYTWDQKKLHTVCTLAHDRSTPYCSTTPISSTLPGRGRGGGGGGGEAYW